MFVLFVLIYPLSKFGGNRTNSLWVLAFYSVCFKWKNWFEKTASIRRVIFTSGQNLKLPFLCQCLIFLRIFLDESSCLNLYINLKIKNSTKWSVWGCTVTLSLRHVVKLRDTFLARDSQRNFDLCLLHQSQKFLLSSL